MDRITMAFGPISDVTGFSHKGGMTFLEIQERLRRGHNDLVVAFNNLVSHVESRNGDLQSAFDTNLERFSVPVAEYAALVDEFNSMMEQMNANTMTDEEIVTALGG